jgi:CRP/FNR family cyclic AMP-dependent transcriptional regulator
MREHVGLLRSVPFLKPLDDVALGEVTERLHEVTFAPGTRFITEGSMDDEAFVIVDGEAEVSLHGRRVRTLDRGQIVGEMAAVASRPRTASVTALTEVRAIVLTGEFLRGLMREHPNVAAVLAREMSARA